MNQYPWWKYLIIGAVLFIGIVYAMPNLFGEDPAVQISPSRDAVMDQSVYERVTKALSDASIEYKGAEFSDEGMLVRFTSIDDQPKAADLIRNALDDPDSKARSPYTVALNLAPATPGWMQSAGLNPMYKGLDLRGGIHFLMEVDMEAVSIKAEERYANDIRSTLRKADVRYKSIDRLDEGGVQVELTDASVRDKALSAINEEFPALENAAGDAGSMLLFSLNEQEVDERRRAALQQNITTLRNRVNELGVAEPVIQQQGRTRIVVQLPGVQDSKRAKEILGGTATLEFRLVDMDHDADTAVRSGRAPLGARLYYERNGQPVLLQKRVMLTGDYIVDASSGLDQQSGSPAVYVNLDSKGAKRFDTATKENVGKLMAVVFIENIVETKEINGQIEKVRETREEVISVATIQSRLGARFQITGLDSTAESADLALLLRAGALAAPIEIIEERTVGPSAGADNIAQGTRAVIIGFIMVMGFMAFYYRRFGWVADLALITNLVLIVAVLSMLQATLTLPGIAGIVLTVGMAVDANVLIFERIREELRAGISNHTAISAGFEKAFSTIADANITTLIAAAVLFSFGTGPVKGFAVTVVIGILTSMFTAIMASRGVVNWFWGRKRTQELPI